METVVGHLIGEDDDCDPCASAGYRPLDRARLVGIASGLKLGEASDRLVGGSPFVVSSSEPAAPGREGESVSHEVYFNIGRSDAGDKHASTGPWGPALCDQTLRTVDDHHHYTADQLDVDLCPSCRALAGGERRSIPVSTEEAV